MRREIKRSVLVFLLFPIGSDVFVHLVLTLVIVLRRTQSTSLNYIQRALRFQTEASGLGHKGGGEDGWDGVEPRAVGSFFECMSGR